MVILLKLDVIVVLLKLAVIVVLLAIYNHIENARYDIIFKYTSSGVSVKKNGQQYFCYSFPSPALNHIQFIKNLRFCVVSFVAHNSYHC